MTIDRKPIVGLLSFAIALIALGRVVDEETYSQLFDENRLVESLTAIFYGIAAVGTLGGAMIEFTRNGLTRRAAGLAAFGTLALFLVAEEVSIWTVFMNTEPPRVLGIRMDAAHDLLHLSLKALKLVIAKSFILGGMLIAVIGGGAAVLTLRYRKAITGRLRDILSSRIGLFMLLCVSLGVLGLIADLRSEIWPVLKSVEESFELTASLSLLIAASIALRDGTGRSEVGASHEG